MFTLQSVELRYGGTVALDGLDLDIKSGEQVCLIGPSGAGKSSLLGLLNGRTAATSGHVSVEGTDLAKLSGKELQKLRSRIAWVPQDLGLVSSLRVHQNVACGRVAEKGFWGLLRSLLGMRASEKAVIHELLKRVGIEEKIFQRADHLSGGQQQRVAIARALYQQPSAILADEPVSAVDPERARDLVALLSTLAKEEGVTLVMSLHDLTLARQFFDRVIGLRDGRVVFDGRADDAGVRDLYRLGGEAMPDPSVVS